jgi:hypothetical protein
MLEHRLSDEVQIKLIYLWMGLCGNGCRSQSNGSANDTNYHTAVTEFTKAFPGHFDDRTLQLFWNVRWLNCINTMFGCCSDLHVDKIDSFSDVLHVFL